MRHAVVDIRAPEENINFISLARCDALADCTVVDVDSGGGGGGGGADDAARQW